VPTPDFDDADFENAGVDNERDDRFEAYLRQFRPLAIEPLQFEAPERATRRSFALAARAAAAAAVILIASVLVFYPRTGPTHFSEGPENFAGGDLPADSQPLTIGSANALLTHSPSVKEALDRVPFHPPSTQLPKGKRSALAVLSEDNDKL
jgi:hypothetical protein